MATLHPMGAKTRTQTTVGTSTTTGPRILAGFLVLHGVAHFVGVGPVFEAARNGERFAFLYGAWRTSDAVLLRTTGVLWAVVGVAVIATAVLLWRGAPTAMASLAAVSAASLSLSIFDLPAAIVGVVIDAALIAVAVTSVRTAPTAVSGRH
jgi:hypothetical protein